jgi:hypothetical protein
VVAIGTVSSTQTGVDLPSAGFASRQPAQTVGDLKTTAPCCRTKMRDRGRMPPSPSSIATAMAYWDMAAGLECS